MGGASPLIEAKDLYKYYGRTRALGPVSFAIEEGEIIGLLGLLRAGSSRSTGSTSSTIRVASGQGSATCPTVRRCTAT